MKTLFIGGIKSGKSHLAETYMLEHYSLLGKPSYLATCEIFDTEMQQRVDSHQKRRQEQFITIEEPIKLLETISACQTPILVECVTMWLNNMLHYKYSEDAILQELQHVLLLHKNIIFVHNEVGLGIIPDNALARQFVDLSGKAAQLMARHCERVFWCSAGLKMQMK